MFRGNMKRLVLSLILFLWVVASGAQGIRTAADLVAFAEAINSGKPTEQWRDENGHVCLEADIDMAKVKKFTPISAFGGTFDGKGHEIRNWTAKNGLFHQLLQDGTVRNLTVAESCVMKVSSSVEEELILGFVVNINNGMVENCVNKGTIIQKSPYAQANIYIGGVVGSNKHFVVNCRNYGEINSNCISTVQKDFANISIGGVVGGAYRKTEEFNCIAWCENYGDITYAGDFPSVNVGGVTGHSFWSPVKYCVNRGNVKVTPTNGTAPHRERFANVGGVTAYVRNDIVGCDNFGSVTVSGTYRAAVGGVLGQPRSEATVTDCMNYGSVSLANEGTSFLGGIIGYTAFSVYIGNCENYGEVKDEGFCPDLGSCVGGIIGKVQMNDKENQAANLSGCINYGNVYSGAGGNQYENEKSICTGGIAGKLMGNSKDMVQVRDCANKGEVSSVTGKKNSFAPIVTRAKVVGEYYNEYAESVEPKADGSNIYGKVTLADGTPIVGVVVSDGLQCVATGIDGTYSMTGDLSKSNSVFISLPSGYEVEVRHSIPQIFKKIRRNEKAVKADFVLSKTGRDMSEYTIAMIGDAQMRGLGYDNSGEQFRDVVIPDMEKLKGENKNFYAMHLGDVVYNIMSGYFDYVDICSKASFPIFNMIGNHDFVPGSSYDQRLGTACYESYIGPTYYSFDIGDVHYIVLNDILKDFPSFDAKYTSGITDEQICWLENDLKFVPKNKTIAVCAHSLLFMKGNAKREKHYRNFYALRDMLAEYGKVYAWAGHSHVNWGGDYQWDGHSFPAVTVARCNGNLRTNKEITADGQPNGYMVVSVKGGDMQWYYKSVGQDKERQMTVYSPARTQDGYVKANIYNYTKGFWQVPQWYENGVLVGELEQFAEPDLDYVESFEKIKANLKGWALKFSNPKNSRYMFRIKPSEGVRKGEVRVTDNFGVTYTQTVEW